MPRPFYSDTNRGADVRPDESLCLNEIEMFDGPGVCTRPKGHQVNNLTPDNVGEFHQEAFEGWVWDNHGRVG